MAGTFNPGGLNTPPTSIVNFWSTTGAAPSLALVPLEKQTLSGALTAATYKELLAVTDSGAIDLCGVYAVDAISRTIGLKVIIDGTTVFDAITSACTEINGSIYALGTTIADSVTSRTVVPSTPVTFNSSLSISVKSSLSEIDKIGLNYRYITT